MSYIGKTTTNGGGVGTFNMDLNCQGVLTTKGLVYETVKTANQTSTNAPTLSYGLGGDFVLGIMITANCSLAVTGIPIDQSKSYTFTVSYQQSTTRYYITTIQILDTVGGNITGGFVAPLWNGGTPSLTGSTNCVIVQSFTVITVGGARRVVSSVSCCS